jgi:hypothetical protein
MILLERKGRKNRAAGDSREQAGKSFGRSLGRMIRALIRFIRKTSFNVTREDRLILTMPTFVFTLLLFFFWEPILPAMVISLFFGVRFHFAGGVDTQKPNRILQKAGDLARDVKDEFSGQREGEEEEKREDTAEEMHMAF